MKKKVPIVKWTKKETNHKTNMNDEIIDDGPGCYLPQTTIEYKSILQTVFDDLQEDIKPLDAAINGAKKYYNRKSFIKQKEKQIDDLIDGRLKDLKIVDVFKHYASTEWHNPTLDERIKIKIMASILGKKNEE